MYANYENIFSGTTSIDDAFAAIEKDSNALLERFADTYK
jgi:sn-glycerol 3-phosphate transport system substrate-binding protein